MIILWTVRGADAGAFWTGAQATKTRLSALLLVQGAVAVISVRRQVHGGAAGDGCGAEDRGAVNGAAVVAAEGRVSLKQQVTHAHRVERTLVPSWNAQKGERRLVF